MSLFFTSNAYAAQVCKLEGKVVNLANGKETAGKSGTVVCKTDGKLLREFEIKDGKEVGKVVLINNQGQREEFIQNEKGNVVGRKRVFDFKMNLIQVGEFDNGKAVGLHKRYFANGKTESLIWETDMRIDYSQDGTVINLICGKKAYIDEDKKLCGWDKVSEQTINGRKYTYKEGKLTKFQDFYDSGKLKSENVFTGDSENRKTYFENGKLKLEKILQDKLLQTENSFYEDGTLKFTHSYEYKDNNVFINKKSFYSNGNRQVEGRFRVSSQLNYDLPVGLIKNYYEITGLAFEENFNNEGKQEGESLYYGEDGRVLLRKIFKDGNLVSEKNF